MPQLVAVFSVFKMHHSRDSPGGPVVRTLRFHCQGLGSIPGWGTKIPKATWHGQKIEKKTPKCITLTSAHVAFPLCLPLIRTLMITFRTHLDNARLISRFNILNFITSVKSIFPCQVTFTGFRPWTFCGEGALLILPPTPQICLCLFPENIP